MYVKDPFRGGGRRRGACVTAHKTQQVRVFRRVRTWVCLNAAPAARPAATTYPDYHTCYPDILIELRALISYQDYHMLMPAQASTPVEYNMTTNARIVAYADCLLFRTRIATRYPCHQVEAPSIRTSIRTC